MSSLSYTHIFSQPNITKNVTHNMYIDSQYFLRNRKIRIVRIINDNSLNELADILTDKTIKDISKIALDYIYEKELIYDLENLSSLFINRTYNLYINVINFLKKNGFKLIADKYVMIHDNITYSFPDIRFYDNPNAYISSIHPYMNIKKEIK